MKRLFLFLVFCAPSLFAQSGYINFDHPVYPFLERMSSLQFIEGYNSFELPKSKKEVAAFIDTLRCKKNQLSTVDNRMLDDFISEFEFELDNTTENYSPLLPGFEFKNLLSGKEKYLFFLTDSNKTGMFLNLRLELENIYGRDNQTDENKNAVLYSYSGIMTGSINDWLGFYIKAVFGSYSGDKNLARTKNNLRHNYKFNLSDEGSSGDNFFDETEGFVCADFNYLKLKIGRDRRTIGYGRDKYLLSSDIPPMDYLSFSVNYSIFDFSYTHGKLIGGISSSADSIQGEIKSVEDKYLVYHRFGLNFSKHFAFGLGEAAVYSRRGLDISYLNPFGYFKSIEHSNQDRDNTMLFFDVQNNSLPGLKLNASLLLDDLDFGKIGSGWYGNQTLWNFNAFYSISNEILPVDLSVQYLRIEPYFYTHRISDNNFTSQGFPVSSNLLPNSHSLNTSITVQLNYRLSLRLDFRYTVHGANKIDENGNVVFNYGGDISVGYRVNDPTNIKFLDGEKEILRWLNLNLDFEPVNNYSIVMNLSFVNDHFRNSVKSRMFYSSLLLRVTI